MGMVLAECQLPIAKIGVGWGDMGIGSEYIDQYVVDSILLSHEVDSMLSNM